LNVRLEQSSCTIFDMNNTDLVKKFDLVIFDFDGTLADSYPWFLSVFDEIAQRFQLPRLERAELDQLRKVDIHRISSEFNVPFWKMIQIGGHLKKMMASQIDKVRLVEGMQTVIDALYAAQIRMAVVSSNAEENIRSVLGAHNAGLFEVYECGVSMFGKKAKFEKVLKKMGIQAERALCLGDELRDLRSARQAGIAFGAVTWGYTDRSMLEKHTPDAVFSSPEQILELVS